MFKVLVFIFLLAITLIGCADMQFPGPEKVLAPWSGAPHIVLGETKDSVRSEWGEPDEIRRLGADDTGITKEEWVYKARRPKLPADHTFISTDSYLVFTGDALTGYRTGQPPSQSEEKTQVPTIESPTQEK